MIEVIKSPKRSEWRSLLSRPSENNDFLVSAVRNIMNRVRTGGDHALIALTEQYDKISISNLLLTRKEIEEQAQKVSKDLAKAIDQAYENIRKFHAAQSPEDVAVETMPGITCRLSYKGITTVGLYIPGGTAPLFSSVLMLAIPAQLAGCENVYICSPPDKSGQIHPAICYAALKCGVSKIFRAGGAQAIAAMTYGTESVPAADKIFGPGNQYVTMAKQLASMEGVAIDMPAGPSEVAIFADNSAVPEFISADLLSQAEHGHDSQVLLVTTDEQLIQKVNKAIEEQLETLPRKQIAVGALKNSRAVFFDEAKDAFEFLNAYAPEHLIIASNNSGELSQLVKNAGSVFLGNLTPEAAGDYASGTNHTLPTNGAARSFSGITLLSFMKTITFQELNREGVRQLAPIVEIMAENEELQAHKLAMQLRRESL